MKFSIITINLNNKNGLEKTINSVLSQSFTDYEFIIVDGGSSDGSLEIIEQYKEYLFWWCSEPDRGVYNAMNKGIDHATGDYLSFINSGDCFYDENTLFRVASEKADADVLYGDWVRWYNDRNEHLMKAPHKISISYFFRGDNICHQAMFVRGDIQHNNKYDEKYMILSDWALWQRLTLAGCSFSYVPYTICRFDANNGLSEKYHDITKNERKIIRNQYPQILFDTLQENKNMYYELKGMGTNFRRMFELRLKHPVYNFFLKLCLLPMFIIAKVFYKEEK